MEEGDKRMKQGARSLEQGEKKMSVYLLPTPSAASSLRRRDFQYLASVAKPLGFRPAQSRASSKLGAEHPPISMLWGT